MKRCSNFSVVPLEQCSQNVLALRNRITPRLNKPFLMKQTLNFAFTLSLNSSVFVFGEGCLCIFYCWYVLSAEHLRGKPCTSNNPAFAIRKWLGTLFLYRKNCLLWKKKHIQMVTIEWKQTEGFIPSRTGHKTSKLSLGIRSKETSCTSSQDTPFDK